MKFDSISIRNFRNFENIKVDLANRNVFFGLNDVGKTNFLYALRFVFDKEVRRANLLDTDFHCKDIDRQIEIIITLDINDTTCVDNQKLRAKLKGAILSNSEKVYIKLTAQYDKNEMVAIPILFWGGDLDNLKEMKQRGYMYEIDYVMNVIYIDSYVDLDKLFKKNVNILIKNEDDEDSNIIEQIESTVDTLNSKISSLSGVKKFEEKIAPEYRKFRNDNVSISVKSEIAIKGLYSNVVPYIKQEDRSELYPTSGEGRKKLLTYSIFDLISEDNAERKINIFLIEEPENHLHKAMQISLSKVLFTDINYKYMFIATHSPYILHEMDDVNLVRIYNETKINSTSQFYNVPSEFSKNRKILNRGLSEAVFADKVLLVEGPSEEILFEKILSVVNPFFESDGGYILSVNGIGFEKYKIILDGLEIKNVIKTDNDLRFVKKSSNYSVLGFSRCNRLCGDYSKLPTDRILENTIESKRNLYTANIHVLDQIRKDNNIHLSKCDLENDLDEFLHEELSEYLGTEDVVNYLQKSKHYNMVTLVEKISDDDCIKIFDHYNFACLKEVHR